MQSQSTQMSPVFGRKYAHARRAGYTAQEIKQLQEDFRPGTAMSTSLVRNWKMDHPSFERFKVKQLYDKIRSMWKSN